MKLTITRILLLVPLTFFSVITWAQDKKIDVDINVNRHKQWYEQPWVWVVAGAVFILLLVAMLRPRRKA